MLRSLKKLLISFRYLLQHHFNIDFTFIEHVFYRADSLQHYPWVLPSPLLRLFSARFQRLLKLNLKKLKNFSAVSQWLPWFSFVSFSKRRSVNEKWRHCKMEIRWKLYLVVLGSRLLWALFHSHSLVDYLVEELQKKFEMNWKIASIITLFVGLFVRVSHIGRESKNDRSIERQSAWCSNLLAKSNGVVPIWWLLSHSINNITTTMMKNSSRCARFRRRIYRKIEFVNER